MKHYYIKDVKYPAQSDFKEVKHSIQFEESVDKENVIISLESDGKLYGVKVPLEEVKNAYEWISK